LKSIKTTKKEGIRFGDQPTQSANQSPFVADPVNVHVDASNTVGVDAQPNPQ
jgi:hypothetical protein